MKKAERKNMDMDRSQILERLFRLYEQQMYRIAYSILNNSPQAEDAVADAFERLIPYLDRCRGLTDMKTKRLVITVLRSSALDIYRKNKREQIHVSLDAENFLDRGVNTIDDYMKRRDCEELAGKIVDMLPEIYAGVIRLRYFYDMDVEEIANILGISVDNVYQRLTRARKIIKNKMGDEFYEQNVNG